eukprot:jgi/Bigna1/85396/estExt_fgenesh1_pg.C_30427
MRSCHARLQVHVPQLQAHCIAVHPRTLARSRPRVVSCNKRASSSSTLEALKCYLPDGRWEMREYEIREPVPLSIDDGRRPCDPKEKEARRKKDDDMKKWSHQLEHNGLMLAPEYQPHGVRPLYEGVAVELNTPAEEMATKFAEILFSEQQGATSRYSESPVFRKNMFEDWKVILGQDHPIESLDLVDFQPLVALLESRKAERDSRTKEEKRALREEKKREKEILNSIFGYALVDGMLEKVAGYMVEGPGWFRGRGDHKMSGRWKRRLYPRDVVLNICEGVPVPRPPMPSSISSSSSLWRWGGVSHNHNGSYIARWNDPIAAVAGKKKDKFIFLDATSSVKSASDQNKFETARKLRNKIKNIRKDVLKKLSSPHPDPEISADTVGVCTLRVEHMSLTTSIKGGGGGDRPSNNSLAAAATEFNDSGDAGGREEGYYLALDFLGKDAMQYTRSVEVPKKVFESLQSCFITSGGGAAAAATDDTVKAHHKAPKDQFFEYVTPQILNKYFKDQMPGLTAKVFRTYNASALLQAELARPSSETARSILAQLSKKKRKGGQTSAHDNSSSSSSSSSTVGMEKNSSGAKTASSSSNKIGESRSKGSKKNTSSTTTTSSIGSREAAADRKLLRQYYDFCHKEVAVLCNHLRTTPKSFDKSVSRLKERLKSQKWWLQMLEIERNEALCHETTPRATRRNRKNEPAVKKARRLETIDMAILKQRNAIYTLERQIDFRKQSKEIALGTSRTNYIDPRITVAWCKRNDVPVERSFPKALLRRFEWALDTKSSFKW